MNSWMLNYKYHNWKHWQNKKSKLDSARGAGPGRSDTQKQSDSHNQSCLIISKCSHFQDLTPMVDTQNVIGSSRRFFSSCATYIRNGFCIVWATSISASWCLFDFAGVILVILILLIQMYYSYILVEEHLFQKGHEAIEIPAFGRGIWCSMAPFRMDSLWEDTVILDDLEHSFRGS